MPRSLGTLAGTVPVTARSRPRAVSVAVAPSSNVTVAFASALPTKVGVVILVTLSVLEVPMSDAASRSGAAGVAGDAKKAIALNNRLIGLHQKLFVEANPIPVKWALARMGRIGEAIRLPLTTLAPAFHESVTAALREAGCLT